MSAPESPSRATAKPPVGIPLATRIAVVLALLVIGIGVVAARDVLIWTGAIAGSPWIIAAVSLLNGLTAHGWMLPAGVVLALLGLLLVMAAITPRRRTHQPLQTADTWITPRDVSRLARSAAEAVTGIAAATASGSVRTLTITVTPLAGYDSSVLKEAVHTVATEAVAALARPPRIRVRFKKPEQEHP